MVAVLLPATAFSQQPETSQLFITGFDAYHKQDYNSAIQSLSLLLKSYPDTALKDMALFWLASAHYKGGNQQEAGRYMAAFLQEYPDSRLKVSVDEGLLALAEKYKKGERGVESLATEPVASESVVAEVPETAAKPKVALVKKQEVAQPWTSSARADKAGAAYKEVIDRIPGSSAASAASARLHQFGIEYPPVATGPAPVARQEEASQVFNVEVTQFADFKLQVPSAPMTADAGRQFVVPIEITNTGNGRDAFSLESGFPTEYHFRFAAASAPDTPITATPPLAAGEKFQAIGAGIIPRTNYDGQKNSFPVKVLSSYTRDVSLSRELALATAAPLLRAVLTGDESKLLPGERITYHVSLSNTGSAAARAVKLAIHFPPQYELTRLPSDAKQEARGALQLDGLELKSGESKEFAVEFKVRDEALAEQELFLRADVTNTELAKKESFVSATSVVLPVTGVSAKTTSGKVVVIPGQTVSIPIAVTNSGNVENAYALKATVPAGATYTFYGDLNRDGKRQAGEPIIDHVGPLAPKEEACIVLEVATPAAAKDGGGAPVSVVVEPEDAAERAAAVDVELAYSRPVVEMALAGNGGRLRPGDVSTLDLNCFNRGSNLAKQVVLQTVLPEQLELLACEPAFSKAENGIYLWRFEELGAGEKRNIRVIYKVKPGITVGTSMQLKNLISYQDQLGNRY